MAHEKTPPANSAPPADAGAENGHDIIVIGASAGGFHPLIRILSELPTDLAASLFIVVHRAVDSGSLLTRALAGGRFRVADAEDGAAIERSIAYIAPPDLHLLVERGVMRVIRGPRENRFRPAIDPLFRSAAWAYGPRVVGVLLSGLLSDGAAGLWAIRSCGGTTVVQDPSDADFVGMPTSALVSLDPDYRVRADEVAGVLHQLIATPAASPEAFPVPEQVRLETEMAQLRQNDINHVSRIGTLSAFTCPQCHGTLWEIDDEHMLRYRCHTGHAFSAESLVAEQEDGLEDALYSAMRALEEQAAVSRRLAARSLERGNGTAVQLFERRALQALENAAAIEQLLANGRDAAREDA